MPENGGVGLGVVSFPNLMHLQRGVFSGLEAFWGLIFLTIAQSFRDKKLIFGMGLLAITCAMALTSCIVLDITRSITYLLPINIIALWYFKSEIATLNKLLTLVCSINLIYPSTFVILGSPDGVNYPYMLHKILGALDILSRFFH
jgi:hypothetical protein